MYDFLAVLLVAPPDAALLAHTRDLRGDGTPIGQAIGALSRVADEMDEAAVRREFDRLFIGVGRGELLPYASYYLTGFLNERPLARLRQDMAGLGIVRSPQVSEPEDHIASLCEMMAGLIVGRFGSSAALPVQKTFFDRHLGLWAEPFFADLGHAASAGFYVPVGMLGRAFIEIEKEAFGMTGQVPG